MVSSSVSEEDPWDLLDEFKVWAVKGKYDMIEFQNAINTLRQECQSNIQTLEKEITSIQETIEQQSQYTSQEHYDYDIYGNSDKASCDDGTIVPVSSVKAVFAGYQTTDADRERLSSAHPEERG